MRGLFDDCEDDDVNRDDGDDDHNDDGVLMGISNTYWALICAGFCPKHIASINSFNQSSQKPNKMRKRETKDQVTRPMEKREFRLGSLTPKYILLSFWSSSGMPGEKNLCWKRREFALEKASCPPESRAASSASRTLEYPFSTYLCRSLPSRDASNPSSSMAQLEMTSVSSKRLQHLLLHPLLMRQ